MITTENRHDNGGCLLERGTSVSSESARRQWGLVPSERPGLCDVLDCLPRTMYVAADTEFSGTHTLTVQVATRLDPATVAVQVYRSPHVPELPSRFDVDQYLPTDAYGRFCKRCLVRPVKLLHPDLSPAHMLLDLYGLQDLQALPRSQGREGVPLLDADSVRELIVDEGRRDGVKVVLVAHFLRADFCRLFGQAFFADLRSGAGESGAVTIRSHKLIQFAECKGTWVRTDPVLGYLSDGCDVIEVRVEMRDTMLPYGSASLDSLSKTFLKLGKSEALSVADKQNMLEVFQTRTADAYGYAIVDAVNTLLVHEQMQAKDRDIYRAFGFAEEAIPELRATLGSRVATFLMGTTLRMVEDSQELGSRRRLEALMHKGGLELFKEHSDASKYGRQTGGTHGGLLYSRSPCRFWHESQGMLRDVDMSGCYNNIVSRLNVYWGRPVIFEPGNRAMQLTDAVRFVQQHADDDAWMIRVSGELKTYPNALVASTENALTSLNYQNARRRGKRRRARRRLFRIEARNDRTSKETGGSRLYSARVESGIMTRTTWLMIQALPLEQRAEYEGLLADSIIFYPRKLVAGDGAEFDKRVEEYSTESLPWESELDLAGMELVKREKIDAEFVSLKYPIGHYAQEIGKYRDEAKKAEGKGSGADLAWKVHANAMYGILASIHLPTNNFVAANQVTAWARAEAFGMSQALNAIQTITDGCTYRLDQIPACTYRECLAIKPDYAISRAEDGDGIPFVDPGNVPGDDAGFTQWYREHFKHFFEVSGPEYDALIGTHGLEHKKTAVTSSVVFDALACDGAGNYAKCRYDTEGRWQIEDFAARAYGRRSKEALKSWLVETYATDRLEELPPITEDCELLSFKRAAQKARKALDSWLPQVYFPLGLENKRVLNYRVFKPSAFIFQSPEQRAALLKQWQKFENDKEAGLELLALRRSYGGRRQGSLRDLAEALYGLIGRGETSLKALNLAKLPERLVDEAEDRAEDLHSRKLEARRSLLARIDTRSIEPGTLMTAYLVGPEDQFDVGAGDA